jgi:tetratricopeptide (TPR) repeat protein
MILSYNSNREELNKAKLLIKTQVNTLDPGNARAQRYLGIYYEATGHPDEAEVAYQEAIECDPSDALAHYSLGRLRRGLGRLETAEVAYREAIKVDPRFVVVRVDLGDLLRDRKLFEEAAVIYREAIKIDLDPANKIRPKLAGVQVELGNSYRDSGDWEEATAAYREAIAIDPELSDKIGPKLAEVQVELGNFFETQDRFKEAEAAYCEAIKLDSELGGAHAALGGVLWDMGRHAAADYAYHTAIFIDRSYAGDFYDKLDGKLRRLAGDLRTVYKGGIGINPNGFTYDQPSRAMAARGFSREILVGSLRRDREVLVTRISELQLQRIPHQDSSRSRGGIRIPPPEVRRQEASETWAESPAVNLFDELLGDAAEAREEVGELGDCDQSVLRVGHDPRVCGAPLFFCPQLGGLKLFPSGSWPRCADWLLGDPWARRWSNFGRRPTSVD